MDAGMRPIAAGTLALLTATAVATFGSPAYAAETDADLQALIPNTTVTTGDAYKALQIETRNMGPDVTHNLRYEYDISGLDNDVLTAKLGTDPRCTSTATTLTCSPGLNFPKGNSYVARPTDVLTLEPKPGKTGNAGSFTFRLLADNDPNPENNLVTVNVEVPPKGVDIAVFAEDVYKVTEDGEITDDPVPPGGTSLLFGGIGNLGDITAKGIRLSAKLPEHVTFSESEPGCVYSADKRTATCNYADITLVPLDKDTDENDDITSVIGVFFPVAVAEDAPGPVVLNGGNLSGYALDSEAAGSPSALALSRTGALPKGLKALSAEDVKDANPSDNTDEFAVHVGAPGSDVDGPGSGSDGEGGGLPVTGVQIGLIAGIGGAVVVVGVVLFVLGRRRRVVLTTPEDEKPTA